MQPSHHFLQEGVEFSSIPYSGDLKSNFGFRIGNKELLQLLAVLIKDVVADTDWSDSVRYFPALGRHYLLLERNRIILFRQSQGQGSHRGERGLGDRSLERKAADFRPTFGLVETPSLHIMQYRLDFQLKGSSFPEDLELLKSFSRRQDRRQHGTELTLPAPFGTSIVTSFSKNASAT